MRGEPSISGFARAHVERPKGGTKLLECIECIGTKLA